MSETSDVPLEDLPFDELRHQAFSVAEHRMDIGFFTDLFGHMPGMAAIEGEQGDLGAIGGTFIETVRAVREMFGSGDLDQIPRRYCARASLPTSANTKTDRSHRSASPVTKKNEATAAESDVTGTPSSANCMACRWAKLGVRAFKRTG